MDIVINADCERASSNSTLLSSQGDFYLNVLVNLGFPPTYPPLADLLMRFKQLEGEWLIVSPIHWQATHNDAMIVSFGTDLCLSDAKARIWFAEISQFLQQDGMTLIYHNPYMWLVRVDGKPSIHSPSVTSMHHQSMMPALAAMDSTLYWQRLNTELQMFMSSHPLNSAKDNHFAMNGVWFWGGGNLDEITPKPWMSDDPLLLSHLNNGVPLDLQAPLKNGQQTIIISNFNPELLPILQALNKKQAINWYWNNLAYHTKRRRWWQR